MAKWTDIINDAGEITHSDRACRHYFVHKTDGRWKCWFHPRGSDSIPKLIGLRDDLSAAQMLCREHLDRVRSTNAGASAT